MHEVMLSIYIFGVVMCFYSTYLIVARRNTERASYMVVAIVLSALSLIGYVLELTSDGAEAMMVAVKIQYLGKAFAGTFLLLTFRRYYEWDLPNGIMWVYWVIDMIMYTIILTADQHKLYYSSIGVKEVDGNHFISLGKTPLYVAFMVYLLVQMMQFAWYCYKQFKKEVGRERKVAISLMVTAVASLCIMIFSLTINKTNYDFVPFIMAMLTVAIAILIKKYGLFTTMDMAKEELITNLNEGVIVRNSSGNFSYANLMAYEMIPELKTLERPEVEKFLDSIVCNNISEINLNNRYYQIQNRNLYEGKEFAGQIITFFDVTKLHDDAKKMEKLKNEADKANNAKSNFLANMSHEIRTPINAVLGMDEMILREAEDPVIIEYANNIKGAGETLLSLVNDVLDLAKIESGKMHLVSVDYKVADMVRSIASTMTLKMTEKGLSFLVEADENIPSVLNGDEMRIRQIILNLLSNAYKYTEEGHVKMTVSGEREDSVYRLRVSVEDTGIGIKEEDVSRLFNSFERMDEKKNKNIEGTGLGLNITNNLLNLMGSELGVESEYGIGSIFSFEICQDIVDDTPIGDISKRRPSGEEDDSGDLMFTAPEAKILVVDDNSINLAVIRGLLKRTKMQVETVTSGMECLQKIKEKEYNVILMDHLMPEMDGVETLRKMRSRTLHRNEHTPVIVLTANAISGARESYMAYGFDEYLTKPVDGKLLEKVIFEFLPQELIEKE